MRCIEVRIKGFLTTKNAEQLVIVCENKHGQAIYLAFDCEDAVKLYMETDLWIQKRIRLYEGGKK